MPDCARIDSLVTPFVDGELPQSEQQTVAQHITVCPPCRAKVAAERAVRALMRDRRSALTSAAPPDLKARCAMLRSQRPDPVVPLTPPQASAAAPRVSAWRKRAAPFALAATLFLTLGGVALYQATRSSSRLMAAELAVDHEKCFRLNRMLGTHQTPDTVRASMASLFGWDVQLPDTEVEDIELVGSRPCLYGEGKVAHIMYKHNGQPVSLFMLPRETRDDQLVEVFGHQYRIWSEGDRTFVLVSSEPAPVVEQMAALVRETIH
jgi:anti-sigma factor (TIGR02949 family)